MKIITTITNEDNYGFNLLKLSCAVNSLEMVAIVSDDYESFVSVRPKDTLLKSYLEDVHNDDIILFTDGYDAVFLSDEKEILEKFRRTKKDLVFSTETNCWPDQELASLYPACDSPYKYLNSGGFIGKAGLIKELLDDNDFDLSRFLESNQYLWAQRFLKHPTVIGLDTQCDLFCTFSPEIGEELLPKNGNGDMNPYYKFKKEWFASNFLVKGGRLFNKITGTWPCQAHFNGISKCLINKPVMDMLFTRIPEMKKIQTVYIARELSR